MLVEWTRLMIWDEHTYLAVDLANFEPLEGCSMVRQEPTKHPSNPLDLEPMAWPPPSLEDPMAPMSGLLLCVAREGGVWRAWYWLGGYGQIGYAESDDGLNFKPVRVGLHEFCGTRDHNRVRIGDGETTRGMNMLHDPLDRDFPYKSVAARRLDKSLLSAGVRAKYPDKYASAAGHEAACWYPVGIARSRDGLAWEFPEAEEPMIDHWIEEPCLFRALDGGMVIGNQMLSQISDIGYRKFKGWVSYDEQTASEVPDYVFSLPDHMTFVHRRYLGQTGLDGIPWVQTHVNLVPARKGPTLVAMHGFLYGNYKVERYAQTADIGLALSGDGYRFDMVWPFQPWLRRGDLGRWDGMFCRQQAMVQTEEQMHFYYRGQNSGNVLGAGGPRGGPGRGSGHAAARSVRVPRAVGQPRPRSAAAPGGNRDQPSAAAPRTPEARGQRLARRRRPTGPGGAARARWPADPRAHPRCVRGGHRAGALPAAPLAWERSTEACGARGLPPGRNGQRRLRPGRLGLPPAVRVLHRMMRRPACGRAESSEASAARARRG